MRSAKVCTYPHTVDHAAAVVSGGARAGIAVHVLLDWVGSSKMDKRYLRMLREAGAEVVQYHKPHWTGLGRMNDRTHRKLLVIDGRFGFTGGVGIADEWTGHAQDEKHWRDMHFRVEGPAAFWPRAGVTAQASTHRRAATRKATWLLSVLCTTIVSARSVH